MPRSAIELVAPLSYADLGPGEGREKARRRIEGLVRIQQLPGVSMEQHQLAEKLIRRELRRSGVDLATARALYDMARTTHSRPEFRAAYLVNAAHRVQRSRGSGTSDVDAIERERKFYNAHVRADRTRMSHGIELLANQQRHGNLLGWYSKQDERVTPECRAAHGQNFDMRKPPKIGLPGITHVGCFPAGTLVSGPTPRAATERWYSGELVEIETRDGHILTSTPNHPVLTEQGWIPAGLLVEGDKVVRQGLVEGPTPIISPDYDEQPTLIEEVFGTLRKLSTVRTTIVPTTSEDFHGDGSDGEVAVVAADSVLLDYGHDAIEPRAQLSFEWAGFAESALPTESHTASLIPGTLTPSGRAMSGHTISNIFLRSAPRHHKSVGITRTTDIDLVSGEYSGDGGPRNIMLDGESIDADPSSVFVDDRVLRERVPVVRDRALHEVAGIRTYSWAGHVYNLHTDPHWYVADGFIVHNCRCRSGAPHRGGDMLSGNSKARVFTTTDVQRVLELVKSSSYPGLERKPGKNNWIENLPKALIARWHKSYMYRVAKHLVYGSGKPISTAIPMAISTTRRWARGGEGVKPKTQAKAVADIALWNLMRATSKANTKARRAVATTVDTATVDGGIGVPSVLELRSPGTARALRALGRARKRNRRRASAGMSVSIKGKRMTPTQYKRWVHAKQKKNKKGTGRRKRVVKLSSTGRDRVKSTYLTPRSTGDAIELSAHTFRKEILRFGDIEFEGDTITFDRPFAEKVIDSFHKQPFPMVPFVMADKDNNHSRDPERVRGEVVDLELTATGLDGVIVVKNDDTAQLLRDYPKLGVSVRIYEQFNRQDKKLFENALQHVLGTFEPAISEMSPWSAVEASAPDQGRVIDLSTPTKKEKETILPKYSADQQDALMARLEGFLDKMDSPDEDENDEENETEVTPDEESEEDTENEDVDSEDDDSDDEELSEEELAELAEHLSKVRAAKAAKKAKAVKPGKRSKKAPVTNRRPSLIAAASDPSGGKGDDVRVIEMSSRMASLEQQNRAMALENDKNVYERERENLVRLHGIPPRIVELARPLLEGKQRVVELTGANGKTEKVDAGKVMREVFKAVGEHTRILDLTAETGSAFGVTEDEAVETRRTDLIAGLRKQYHGSERESASSNGNGSN